MQKMLVAGLMLALAACTSKQNADSGKDFFVASADVSAPMALSEAVRRGRSHGLDKPFTVYTKSETGEKLPLFQLSWSEGAQQSVNWKQANPDKALDQAGIVILSTAGLSPFYDYCFSTNEHAEAATKFCTVTLITAMKSHSSEKERAAEATLSSAS